MVRPDRLLWQAFAIWLPVAVAATVVMLLVFVASQQALRRGANDPQIQMAEDAAAHLDGGAGPAAVLPSDHVDIAHSLAPFVIIFDRQGRPLASSAVLDGQTPLPPHGVLSSIPSSGRREVTWQPAPGVRSAAVVVAYANGSVLAGRSLRVVEERESVLSNWVILAWFGMLVLSGLGAIIGVRGANWAGRSGPGQSNSAA